MVAFKLSFKRGFRQQSACGVEVNAVENAGSSQPYHGVYSIYILSGDLFQSNMLEIPLLCGFGFPLKGCVFDKKVSFSLQKMSSDEEAQYLLFFHQRGFV